MSLYCPMNHQNVSESVSICVPVLMRCLQIFVELRKLLNFYVLQASKLAHQLKEMLNKARYVYQCYLNGSNKLCIQKTSHIETSVFFNSCSSLVLQGFPFYARGGLHVARLLGQGDRSQHGQTYRYSTRARRNEYMMLKN